MKTKIAPKWKWRPKCLQWEIEDLNASKGEMKTKMPPKGKWRLRCLQQENDDLNTFKGEKERGEKGRGEKGENVRKLSENTDAN